MLKLDSETGDHWECDSISDLGDGAEVLLREPYKPGVDLLYVRWPQGAEFRTVFMRTPRRARKGVA